MLLSLMDDGRDTIDGHPSIHMRDVTEHQLDALSQGWTETMCVTNTCITDLEALERS